MLTQVKMIDFDSSPEDHHHTTNTYFKKMHTKQNQTSTALSTEVLINVKPQNSVHAVHIAKHEHTSLQYGQKHRKRDIMLDTAPKCGGTLNDISFCRVV